MLEILLSLAIRPEPRPDDLSIPLSYCEIAGVWEITLEDHGFYSVSLTSDSELLRHPDGRWALFVLASRNTCLIAWGVSDGA